MPGVPDILICDETGRFHFIELKATGGNAVELRPHQVSWLSRHSHASTWIFVRRSATRDPRTKVQREDEYYLYRGEDAMDVKFEGLEKEPVLFYEKVMDWDAMFEVICPNVSRETS